MAQEDSIEREKGREGRKRSVDQKRKTPLESKIQKNQRRGPNHPSLTLVIEMVTKGGPMPLNNPMNPSCCTV